MREVRELDDLILDDRVKGMPGGVEPFRLGDIPGHHWNVLREDLPLPLAVLKQSALDNNERWMAAFLAETGASIAPHGKTTMSPQLFERQLAHGAWGMTVATVAQLQVARRYGCKRVVLANQLVGRQAVRYVAEELRRDPGFEFWCLVDTVAGVEQLAARLSEIRPGRPLQVLLEGGVSGGRTGCRDLESGLTVARAVGRAAPHLSLCGVEGFEGLIHAEGPHEQEARVRTFLEFLVELAEACATEKLFAAGPLLLSAGGSAYYDLVVDIFGKAILPGGHRVLTRSGCYITQDSAMYRRSFDQLTQRSSAAARVAGGLVPALEVWAYVQSRAEPTRAILTAGKRDLSHDADMPLAEKWLRPGTHRTPVAFPGESRIVELNDQHAHLQVPPDSPLEVGDMIGLGVSHPCTTFDKWQVLCVVDDDYNVISAIRTFF